MLSVNHPMEISRLPLSTQSLYQQLVEMTIEDDLNRTIGHLRGTFVTKKVKGRLYWYLQYSEAGVQKQVYLGAESQLLKETIARWRWEREKAQTALSERQRLCAMLRQGGALFFDIQEANILDLLAKSGLFHLGIILVGTHAFRAYANMLGVNWHGSAIRTFDFDLAQHPDINLALTADTGIDLEAVLERAHMGFIPIPTFDPRHPTTSFKVAGQEIKIDLLAPLIGPPTSTPIPLPALKSYAQPLRFLDYLIEESVQTVLLGKDGILVNVPLPARFAWHKLIIANHRPVTEHGKREKDLMQARQLLDILVSERPGDIILAWEGLIRKGKNWGKHAKKGLEQTEDSDLVKKVMRIVSA